MDVFVSPETDPAVNLGLEGFFLEHYEGEGCLLYRNTPSIIIGKNQNPYRELNIPVCKEKGLPFFRRLSGGGAVYHDLGNLNTAFFGVRKSIGENLYERWKEPMIQFLSYGGWKAICDGRNGLELDGCKISGSAQALKRDRYLHHATLLYSADLSVLKLCLNPGSVLVEGQAIHSVRSDVTNLSVDENLKLSMESFQNSWLQFLLLWGEFGKQQTIPEEGWITVKKLAETKFNQRSWNVDRTPPFKLKASINDRPLKLGIKKGLISAVEGDGIVEKGLNFKNWIGEPLTKETIQKINTHGILNHLEDLIL
tara:strand:+ start:1981 stop:2910 length:930 start_codon:yes stop_codon:yes gene_type:complete